MNLYPTSCPAGRSRGLPRCLRLPARPRAQRGVALFTAMVLLFALTIAAITAIRSTTLDYRIVANTAYHDQAFEVSERSRRMVGSVLDAHIDERGWTGVTLPPGLTVAHPNSILGLLYAGNNAALGDLRSSKRDFKVTLPLGIADVFAYRLDQQLATGTGAATAEGYAGLGFGSAAGGGLLFFDLRSRGEFAGGARAVTGADFRHVIR